MDAAQTSEYGNNHRGDAERLTDGHRRAEDSGHPPRGSPGEKLPEGSTMGSRNKMPPPSNRHAGGFASKPLLGNNVASILHRPDEKTKAQ